MWFPAAGCSEHWSPEPGIDLRPGAAELSAIGFLLVVVTVLIAGAIASEFDREALPQRGQTLRLRFDRLLKACFACLRGPLIAIALLTAYIAFGPQRWTRKRSGRSVVALADCAILHAECFPSIFVETRIRWN